MEQLRASVEAMPCGPCSVHRQRVVEDLVKQTGETIHAYGWTLSTGATLDS